MQFELGNPAPDAITLVNQLRALDPRAKVTVDAGVLDIISTASANQIVRTLGLIGCEARLLDDEVHVSGGSTCCGGCA
ncbi:hypothetical protein [Dokdonella sp.]|uniref:hypothetical protein n=1 Tax=Dokdonella sp. TaxID=2291710 RepID=UPI003AF96ABA